MMSRVFCPIGQKSPFLESFWYPMRYGGHEIIQIEAIGNMNSDDTLSTDNLSFENPMDSLAPTAQNILKTARRMVIEQGAGSLHLSAIAREAGESKASIGYHFGNKEGLLSAVVDSLVHDANRGIIEDTTAIPMGIERIDQYLESEREIIKDFNDSIGFFELFPKSLRNDEMRTSMAKLYQGYFETVMLALDAETTEERAALEPLAHLMIALVDGFSIQHVLDPEDPVLDEAIDLWGAFIRHHLRSIGMIPPDMHKNPEDALKGSTAP